MTEKVYTEKATAYTGWNFLLDNGSLQLFEDQMEFWNRRYHTQWRKEKNQDNYCPISI